LKTYLITDNSVEKIELKAEDDTFGLVSTTKAVTSNIRQEDVFKAIILNKRELLTLYQAIQEVLLYRLPDGRIK